MSFRYFNTLLNVQMPSIIQFYVYVIHKLFLVVHGIFQAIRIIHKRLSIKSCERTDVMKCEMVKRFNKLCVLRCAFANGACECSVHHAPLVSASLVLLMTLALCRWLFQVKKSWRHATKSNIHCVKFCGVFPSIALQFFLLSSNDCVFTLLLYVLPF